MQVSVDDIFKFCETRIACHVKAVNYFAGILGYAFPEHDDDKTTEPIRTGYAYIFYNNYHPDLHLMNEYFDLCNDAQQIHHKHATHHVQHYDNVQNIPDVILYEMVSDWSSANFEQRNIIKSPDAKPITEWFEQNMAALPWTQHQLDLIHNSLKTIQEKTDTDAVKAIWQDLLKLV